MQTAKSSGQFENSVFEIHAIKENGCIIARCPFKTLACTIHKAEEVPTNFFKKVGGINREKWARLERLFLLNHPIR